MKTIFLIFFLSASLSGYSQSDYSKRKSVFFEILGSGGLGSINYEQDLFQKKNIQFTGRVGLSFAPIDKNTGTAIIFPLMFNALYGKGNHKFEMGIGQGFSITTKGSPFALTIASIGYRYQNPTKKWFYKIAYTPLISYLVDFQVQQWGGFGIGYTFNLNH